MTEARLITDLGWGLLAGLLCAIGGAIKDFRFEGFKPLTFPRSIVVGIVGGAAAAALGTTGLVALAVAGYLERVIVEGWKILRGKMPGKFAGKGGCMSRSLHRGVSTMLLLLLAAIFLLAGCTNGWVVKPPYCQPVNLPCKYMAIWNDLSGAGVYVEATSVVALNPIKHWWDSQVWAVRDCHTGMTYQIYGPVDYWPLKKVSK